VSLRDENNLVLCCARRGKIPSLCAPYYCLALSPVDATVQLSRLVTEGGSDPRTFWAAESRKSGVLPRVSVVSIPLLLGFRLLHRVFFQRTAAPQGEDIGEGRGAVWKCYVRHCSKRSGNLREHSWGCLGRPLRDESLTLTANYPMDGTFRCRIIRDKNARTGSAGSEQLARSHVPYRYPRVRVRRYASWSQLSGAERDGPHGYIFTSRPFQYGSRRRRFSVLPAVLRGNSSTITTAWTR
jgi:hypothetical protein